MMVQVQNQHVSDWMNTESKNSRKRRKDDGGSTISPDNRPQPIMVPPTRIQNEGDNMLRQVFSANADMWQDGGGHSVADVFAVVPVSSPVASSFDGRIIGSTHTPSASITHDLSIHEKTDATGSATTTPTKQIPIFDAYKDMPTTLSMKDMRAKFERPAISPKDKSKNLTNLESPLSRSQNSAATPTKTSLHPANASITPSPNRISSPSSSHGDLSTRREHATKQHPAPSAADEDDEVHVSNSGKASSSFQSESSNGSWIRRPVFRFQRRVDAVDERVGADLLLKE
jgi:nitrogen fixation protein FixH